MAAHGPARGVRCGAVRCRPLMSHWAGQSTLGPGRALVARPARALVGSCRGMAAALQLRCLLLPIHRNASHPATAAAHGIWPGPGGLHRSGRAPRGWLSLTHSLTLRHSSGSPLRRNSPRGTKQSWGSFPGCLPDARELEPKGEARRRPTTTTQPQRRRNAHLISAALVMLSGAQLAGQNSRLT